VSILFSLKAAALLQRRCTTLIKPNACRSTSFEHECWIALTLAALGPHRAVCMAIHFWIPMGRIVSAILIPI